MDRNFHSLYIRAAKDLLDLAENSPNIGSDKEAATLMVLIEKLEARVETLQDPKVPT